MRFGFDWAIATTTLPTSPLGSPCPCSRFHVMPPSFVTNRPLPGPPLSRPHVLILSCHIPAKSLRGFEGSMASDEQPVFSSTNRVRSQVLPPSVVRNTPRSCCGPYPWPSEHANTTSGLVGWITTRAIRPVFSSPIRVHVLPAS